MNKQVQTDSPAQLRAVERARAGQADAVKRGDWVSHVEVGDILGWPVSPHVLSRLAAVGAWARSVANIDAKTWYSRSAINQFIDTPEARDLFWRRYDAYVRTSTPDDANDFIG